MGTSVMAPVRSSVAADAVASEAVAVDGYAAAAADAAAACYHTCSALCSEVIPSRRL